MSRMTVALYCFSVVFALIGAFYAVIGELAASVVHTVIAAAIWSVTFFSEPRS